GATHADTGVNPFGETRRKRRSCRLLRIDCTTFRLTSAWAHAGSRIFPYLERHSPPTRGHAACSLPCPPASSRHPPRLPGRAVVERRSVDEPGYHSLSPPA